MGEREKGGFMVGLTGTGYPTPASNVGNGDLVAGKVLCLGQLRVHGLVETAGLVAVTVDAVLDLLGCVAWKYVSRSGCPYHYGRGKALTLEVVGLALHGTQTTHLPMQLFNYQFMALGTNALDWKKAILAQGTRQQQRGIGLQASQVRLTQEVIS